MDAKDVPKEQRLVVDQVQFNPNPVTSRNSTITVRIKVKDTRGNVVRNATVFIRSTPKVTSGGDNAATATDGWVQYSLLPTDEFPLKTGYNVQFFVKAYRATIRRSAASTAAPGAGGDEDTVGVSLVR